MIYVTTKKSHIRAFNGIHVDANIGTTIKLNDNGRISVSIGGKEVIKNNRYDVCPNPAFICFNGYKVQPYALDKCGLDYLEALGLIIPL